MKARNLLSDSMKFSSSCLRRFDTDSSLRSSMRLRLRLRRRLPFCWAESFLVTLAGFNSSSIKGICCSIHRSNMLWLLALSWAMLNDFVRILNSEMSLRRMLIFSRDFVAVASFDLAMDSFCSIWARDCLDWPPYCASRKAWSAKFTLDMAEFAASWAWFSSPRSCIA